MGTNYYLRRDFCPCCGQPRQELHIGKMSCGWRFLAHIYKDDMTFDDYKEFIRSGTIYDEYGKQIIYRELLKDIYQVSGKKSNPNTNYWIACDYTKDDFS